MYIMFYMLPGNWYLTYMALISGNFQSEGRTPGLPGEPDVTCMVAGICFQNHHWLHQLTLNWGQCIISEDISHDNRFRFTFIRSLLCMGTKCMAQTVTVSLVYTGKGWNHDVYGTCYTRVNDTPGVDDIILVRDTSSIYDKRRCRGKCMTPG